MSHPLCYTIRIKEIKNMTDKKQTVMISPTNKASQRTKNRIREHGPFFSVDWEKETEWLLRSGVWLGWLPRSEFHIEWVGKKDIEKVIG